MAQMVVCTKQRPECYLKPGMVMGITPSSSARVPVASHPCQQLACSVFGPLSLIKRETPLLPLSVHPSLSPFTRAPSQQSRPSFFQTWVFTLSSTGCHGAAFDVLPPPLSVSCFPPAPSACSPPCCLPLPAETLEGDSASLLLLLRTYSAGIHFTPSCAGLHTQDPLALLSRSFQLRREDKVLTRPY